MLHEYLRLPARGNLAGRNIRHAHVMRRRRVEELFRSVDILQEQVSVEVFLALEVRLAWRAILLRGLVHFEDSFHLVCIFFFVAELHKGLVLGKGQILQVVWIPHILAFDLEVRFVPLSVLLRHERALQELF